MTTMSLKSVAIFCSIFLMSYQYMIGRNTHSANNLTENEGQQLVPQLQPSKKLFFSLSKKLPYRSLISHQNPTTTIQHSINESYKTNNNSNPRHMERARTDEIEEGKFFSKFNFQSPTKATTPKQQNHGKLLGYESPARRRSPKRSSALTGVAELEELVHICTE